MGSREVNLVSIERTGGGMRSPREGGGKEGGVCGVSGNKDKEAKPTNKERYKIAKLAVTVEKTTVAFEC